MNIRLDSQRALVTGGSSGIGEAIALSLAAAGARVAVNYSRHTVAAEKVVARIRDAGGEACAIKADVADPKSIVRMFAQIDATWGGLDLLVNNAGIDGEAALAWEADPEEWQRVLRVNLEGAFFCAAAALKRMVKKKRGVIINLTSVHEQIAWSGYSAYTASKAGVSMLTKTLAQEAAPHGIRVLAVAPGAIRTPINRAVWSSRKGLNDLRKKIPLGRIGEPAEVANMIVVLASGAASYITGCTVFIDGGMTDYPDFAHGG